MLRRKRMKGCIALTDSAREEDHDEKLINFYCCSRPFNSCLLSDNSGRQLCCVTTDFDFAPSCSVPIPHKRSSSKGSKVNLHCTMLRWLLIAVLFQSAVLSSRNDLRPEAVHILSLSTNTCLVYLSSCFHLVYLLLLFAHGSAQPLRVLCIWTSRAYSSSTTSSCELAGQLTKYAYR